MQARRWYERFAELGLGYGSTFQGISNLRAFAAKNQVVADLSLKPTATSMKNEATYPIHPATLDTSIQLLLIAVHGGKVEKAKTAFVPLSISELSIWIPQDDTNGDSEDFVGVGMATGRIQGLRNAFGDTQIFTRSGAALLDIRHLRCGSYQGSASNTLLPEPIPRSPFTRLIWKPCLDSLSQARAIEIFPPEAPAKSVFDKLDNIAACIIAMIHKSQDRLSEEGLTDHLQYFLSWVKRHVESVNDNISVFIKKASLVTPSEPSKALIELFAGMDDCPEARLMKQVFENLQSLLDGRTSAEVLLQENLANIYRSGISVSASYIQVQRIVDLAAHKAPTMKILEVGAGFMGTTRAVLKTLKDEKGYKRYNSYTITDTSTSYLDSAGKELVEHDGLIFRKLNIEECPLEQGFEADYDLVIASQVLHLTKDHKESLRNTRNLLKPGGKLVVLEPTRLSLYSELILRIISSPYDTSEERLRTVKQWSELFSQSGFSGTDIVLDNYLTPEATASVMVTTATAPAVKETLLDAPDLYLIYQNSIPPLAKGIQALLYTQHKAFKSIALSEIEAIPSGSRVISLVELSGRTFNHFDGEEFERMKSLLHRVASLTWLSAGGAIEGSNPESAIMVGILRSVAKEVPLVKFICIDVGVSNESDDTDLVRMIVEKEASLHEEQSYLAWDTEFALYHGTLHVSRLIPDGAMNSEYSIREYSADNTQMMPLDKQGPLKANYARPGILSSLYFDETRISMLH